MQFSLFIWLSGFIGCPTDGLTDWLTISLGVLLYVCLCVCGLFVCLLAYLLAYLFVGVVCLCCAHAPLANIAHTPRGKSKMKRLRALPVLVCVRVCMEIVKSVFGAENVMCLCSRIALLLSAHLSLMPLPLLPLALHCLPLWPFSAVCFFLAYSFFGPHSLFMCMKFHFFISFFSHYFRN